MRYWDWVLESWGCGDGVYAGGGGVESSVDVVEISPLVSEDIFMSCVGVASI